MTKEIAGYRLKLSSDYGVTHDYGLLSQTVSGTIGEYTFTASSTLATASIGVGSKIHIGASFHEYTVVSVETTIITVVEPLTQTYGAGTGLRIDIVSSWDGSEGFGSLAAQSDATKKPGFIPNIVNNLNAIEFPGGTKALLLTNYSQSDNIFANGGTLILVLGADTAGNSSAGHPIIKSTSSSATAWALITTTFAGGYYRMTFNQVTDGTIGTFTTESVLLITEPQIFAITYNSSTPTIPPVMRVIGATVAVNVDSEPTGAALDDAGGVYIVGNRAAGDRGFDGRILECYAYPYVLSDYQLANMDRYLANKWGVTLFDKATQYYGGREFIVTYPLAGVRKMLICLHGGGGDGFTFVQQLQLGDMFGDIAVLCFPTATKNNATPGANTWNSNFPPPTFNQAPDSKYLKDLCEYVKGLALKRDVIVDEVFIVGHSNGGMMAYRLLIDHPEYFAGAFAMSADVMVENPNTYTGRIQHYHGEDDANVPLAGGVGIGGVDYPPVFPAVSTFTDVNNGEGIILDASFVILPSPAAHSVLSLKTALALAPYSTTIQQVIFDFVYQVGYLLTTQDGDFITTDDGDYIVTG